MFSLCRGEKHLAKGTDQHELKRLKTSATPSWGGAGVQHRATSQEIRVQVPFRAHARCRLDNQ